MQLVPVNTTPFRRDNQLISDEEARALARTTINLFRAWGLRDAEAQTLLGGMSTRTYSRWKAGEIVGVGRDLRMRMAHIMGIHKGLRYLFRDPARGYAWIRKPNANFDQNSALDIMLRGEMSDLELMREWLNAERGAR